MVGGPQELFIDWLPDKTKACGNPAAAHIYICLGLCARDVYGRGDSGVLRPFSSLLALLLLLEF